MNNYILLLFNPIHALNTRYLAKVFGVVRDNGQIIKVDFAVKRTTIITMLHHLIVLFSFFCFRPNTCQFKKFSLTFFCRKCCCLFFGHNQFVGQPLTIVLRERKPLQK